LNSLAIMRGIESSGQLSHETLSDFSSMVCDQHHTI